MITLTEAYRGQKLLFMCIIYCQHHWGHGYLMARTNIYFSLIRSELNLGENDQSNPTEFLFNNIVRFIRYDDYYDHRYYTHVTRHDFPLMLIIFRFIIIIFVRATFISIDRAGQVHVGQAL